MAKKQYFDQTFGKEEKVDRKRIIAKKARRYHCDHKITEKGDEVSLLKVVSADQCPEHIPFMDENGALKCTKCKRHLPIEPQELSEIREKADYSIAILDVVKAAMPNISEERLAQFASVQIVLDQLDELYRVHYLNNRPDRRYDDNDVDDYVSGETFHIDTRDARNTYDFNDNNKKKNKNKNYYKKNNNHKKNKKHRSSSIFDY